MSSLESPELKKEQWSEAEIIELEVPWSAIDENEHANYGAIQELFAKTQWIFMNQHGCGGQDWLDNYGIRVFMRRMTVDFLQEMHEGDRVRMETRVKVGDSSITFAQRIIDSTGTVFAGAETVTVTTKDGKPVRVPDQFRQDVYA